MKTETKPDATELPKSVAAFIKAPATSSVVGPLEEVERLVGHFLPKGWISPMGWHWPILGGSVLRENSREPRIDMIDQDNEILLRVELPGVDKKDVDISVGNGTLNIKACLPDEAEVGTKDFSRREIAPGNFFRSLSIPRGIDEKLGVKASLKNGILEIVLPKQVSTQRYHIKVA